MTACKEGALQLGPHMHPGIILSAVPMGLSMPSWESGDNETIESHLTEGINQIAKSGAEFFICPDNTAHIVLEKIIDKLPIPGLHIADVVCHEIVRHGWKKVGLLGTKWTMTGPVYERALGSRNLLKMIPDESYRTKINRAIFEELCQGIFEGATISLFREAIQALKRKGAECVILGCTEIPLIINSENSPLPVVDSTRLLAKYSVRLALSETELPDSGWIKPV